MARGIDIRSLNGTAPCDHSLSFTSCVLCVPCSLMTYWYYQAFVLLQIKESGTSAVSTPPLCVIAAIGWDIV